MAWKLKRELFISWVGWSLFQNQNISPFSYILSWRRLLCELSRLSGSKVREAIWTLEGHKEQYEWGSGTTGTILKVHRLSTAYTQLHVLRRLSQVKWNIKVGYQPQVSIQEKQMPAWDQVRLLDMWDTAFGSLKVMRDFTRKRRSKQRLLGISMQRKVRVKTRVIMIHWGLMSGTWQRSNEMVEANLWITGQSLGKYRYRAFQVNHLIIELMNTSFLKNGNAVR